MMSCHQNPTILGGAEAYSRKKIFIYFIMVGIFMINNNHDLLNKVHTIRHKFK